MRTNGVEAAIIKSREAGTKKDARNQNCAQMGSAYLGVLRYHTLFVDQNGLYILDEKRWK